MGSRVVIRETGTLRVEGSELCNFCTSQRTKKAGSVLGDSNHGKKDPDYVGTCDHTSNYATEFDPSRHDNAPLPCQRARYNS